MVDPVWRPPKTKARSVDCRQFTTPFLGVDTFFIDKAPAWARRWKTLIEESDSQSSLRAYETATAWAVRQGLRNGSLYSKYGFEYSDPARHLMPADVWKERRSSYQLEKDLPGRGCATAIARP